MAEVNEAGVGDRRQGTPAYSCSVARLDEMHEVFYAHRVEGRGAVRCGLLVTKILEPRCVNDCASSTICNVAVCGVATLKEAAIDRVERVLAERWPPAKARRTTRSRTD